MLTLMTVLYEEEIDIEQWIYYEQDGFVVTRQL